MPASHLGRVYSLLSRLGCLHQARAGEKEARAGRTGYVAQVYIQALTLHQPEAHSRAVLAANRRLILTCLVGQPGAHPQAVQRATGDVRLRAGWCASATAVT